MTEATSAYLNRPPRSEAQAIADRANAWVTNDPIAAQRLHTADRKYLAARTVALEMPLAAKIIAFRKAREERDADYRRIAEGR